MSAADPTESVPVDGLGIVERWCVGRHRTNAYIVYGADRRALVIDPGWHADRLLDRCKHLDLMISALVLTHAHFDHVGAAQAVSEAANLPVLVHSEDVRLLRQAPIYGLRVDGVRIPPVAQVQSIEEGAEIVVSDALTLTAAHAPGHTRGGILLFGGEAIFTGDTLLPDEAGRTDLPGGSAEELAATLTALRTRVRPGFHVFPGHGASFSGREALEYIDSALAGGAGIETPAR